jgi:hypothetical protein
LSTVLGRPNTTSAFDHPLKLRYSSKFSAFQGPQLIGLLTSLRLLSSGVQGIFP